MLQFFIIRAAGHSRLGPSLSFCLKLQQSVLLVPISHVTVFTLHSTNRFPNFLRSVPTIQRPMFPEPVILVSHPRPPPMTQTAPKPNCGSGDAYVFSCSRSRVATSSSLLLAQLLEMEACNVVVVGQCSVAHGSVFHSVIRSESGSKRQDTNTHSTH